MIFTTAQPLAYAESPYQYACSAHDYSLATAADATFTFATELGTVVTTLVGNLKATARVYDPIRNGDRRIILDLRNQGSAADEITYANASIDGALPPRFSLVAVSRPGEQMIGAVFCRLQSVPAPAAVGSDLR